MLLDIIVLCDVDVSSNAPFISVSDSRKISFELWRDLRKYRGDSKRLSMVRDEEEVDLALEETLRLEMDQQKVDASKQSKMAAPSAFSKADSILGGYNLLNPDRIIFSSKCEIITQSTNATNPPAYGTISVSKHSISYVSTERDDSFAVHPLNPGGVVARGNVEHLWACAPFPNTEWRMEEVIYYWRRCYQLRNVAVELFLSNRTSVFINFMDQTVCRKFEKTIAPYLRFYRVFPVSISAGAMSTQTTTDVSSRVTAADLLLKGLTQAWCNREISNFEYLMQLNTFAGRSFNDLGQYPVFPWVLSDYTSAQLDLRDPASFRDLKWPIGAQMPKQRETLMAKYRDLYQMYQMNVDGTDDGYKMPPFHFGSHYSAAAFVLWYLIRLEPFTSLHIQLQEGKFDKADRLFDSIAATWRGCISNPTDVKELVPEMFYCPEILENVNHIDFGTTQSERRIDAVKLPPWAVDAQDFVMQHREALESEFVSRNLHHWIDLIFGYKQCPPHVPGGNISAVESCNVFFHLTYAGAVDLDELCKNDRALYEQYVKQIGEFGQTPTQLFTSPHAERLPIDTADIIFPIASVVRGIDTVPKGGRLPIKPKRVVSYKSFTISIWPIVLITEFADRIITLDSSRVLGVHAWLVLPPDVMPPFKIKVDQGALDLSQG